MYRRSCGYTAERIDASRRPRIDLRVVKLTSGLRTTTSPPVLPESQAVGRGVSPYSESRRTQTQNTAPHSPVQWGVDCFGVLPL